MAAGRELPLPADQAIVMLVQMVATYIMSKCRDGDDDDDDGDDDDGDDDDEEEEDGRKDDTELFGGLTTCVAAS